MCASSLINKSVQHVTRDAAAFLLISAKLMKNLLLAILSFSSYFLATSIVSLFYFPYRLCNGMMVQDNTAMN